MVRRGREKPVLRKHPWIFSGSVDRVKGDPGLGGSVRVLDADGAFLAWACYSPQSQIRARIMSWAESEPIGPALFKDLLVQSISDRKRYDTKSDSVRLVHGESDGLPGLILDRYGDVLVMQVLSAGVERWHEEIVSILMELESPASIYERSDAEVRSLEGLEPRTGLLAGDVPPQEIRIRELNLDFNVDIQEGHKTGFYLDQRSNRALVQSLAQGKDILDCFSYTGGFALHALQGGARSATLIDSSRGALQRAKDHVRLNELPETRVDYIQGNVFEELRTLRDKARKYDMIILDPPKFAPTASQAKQAARGYKDINLWAFKLLKRGGELVTFSCSGGIDRDFFQKIVADAALDAGVDAKIRKQLWQDADHPVGLNFPEGSYLKGFLIRVV